MPAAKTAETDGPRFDDILVRLKTLVEKLEGGHISLEESLQTFEEGIALCKRGQAILDGAERKVEVLLGQSGGSAQVTAFAPENRDD